MALQADEVRVGITGELFTAPLGTAAPSNASDPLTADWIGHGYVSEDGVTEGYDDSVDNIVAWQNATVIRAARTESVATIQCKLIQTRGSNLELFHPGSHVTANGPEWRLDVKPAGSDPRAFCLNVIDGPNLIRIYAGNAEVTERSEIQYANGEPVGYDVTITTYPDADGNLMVKMSNSAAWGIDIGS